MTTLTTGRFEKPRANWLITKYVRGSFLGQADNLAASDEEYPRLQWEGRLSTFRRNDDGTHKLSFEEEVTVVGGDGVQFRPEALEVRGPENDPLE